MAQASGRTLVGADEAGFAAVEIGLLHPAVFGRIVAHSIYPLSKGDAELLALVDRTPASSQRFYLDWGRYDPRRKADLLDIAGFTERLRDRLRARGYRVEGREYPDGSAVPFWSARAVQALRILQKEDN
jgi:enterochelin esterase-like enzyme